MIEWLFFDGIDTEAGAATVCCEHHLSVNVLTDKTETAISGIHRTFTRAQITDHPLTIATPPLSRVQARVLIQVDQIGGGLIHKRLSWSGNVCRDQDSGP
jgi:hypothetical protein